MSQREDLLSNKNAFSWLEEPEEEYEFCKHKEVDILIIGAGHAGTAAARGAIETEPNAKVLVIEQQSQEKQRILGNGEIGHINSEWQNSQGVMKVDIDEFVNDWQLRTNNRSNYALIRKYAEKCGDCFDWMIEPLNEMEKQSIYPMIQKPSTHMPKELNYIHAYPGTAKMPVEVQNSLIMKNQRLAMKKGVEFLFQTKACKLLTNKGAITGAVVKSTDGYVKIEVRNGVILAAGDYSQNEQMCRDLLTEAADLIEQGTNWLGHGWNGDGLRLGMLAGGRMEPRSHAALGGNYSMPGFEVIGATAVLRVNKYGKRYSNEGFGTHVLAALAGAKQPNGMLYGIFDSNILEQTTYQTHCHSVFDYCSDERVKKLEVDLLRAKEASKDGVSVSAIPGNVNNNMPRRIYCGNTVEELAEILFENLDIQKDFLRTVERYNQLCKDGKDVDYGKDSALLHGIITPPFYAVSQLKDSHHPIGQSYKLLVTVSGLLIDENQQVLNEEYEPIRGLYASGNNSGCRFGFQYTTSVSGQSISIAQTLGREVGKYVALEKRKSHENNTKLPN